MQLALRGCRFFQSLLLGDEIRLDVSMGRLNALMSKPQGDGADIDTRLEQVHGGRVPDHVRSNAFGEEAWAVGAGTLIVGRSYWRSSGWSRLSKAWPELLHDAADSG